MNRNRFIMASVLFVALAWSAVGSGSERLYTPRYQDVSCPPEYPETRDWIERFMRVDHLGGRLKKLFGKAAPASISEVRLLKDESDAAVCSYFGELYDLAINIQHRIFDQSEAYYIHDVSFYQGGEFYFVAIGGGILMEKHPDTGQKVLVTSELNGVRVYDKKTLEVVDWELLYDETCPDTR